jgi:hypothetical protein
MNVAVCFTSDTDNPDMLNHLVKWGERLTLCGKRAMPPRPGRHRVTCDVCLERKPKVMGGAG